MAKDKAGNKKSKKGLNKDALSEKVLGARPKDDTLSDEEMANVSGGWVPIQYRGGLPPNTNNSEHYRPKPITPLPHNGCRPPKRRGC